jgi:competence protein ComFC
VVPIYRLTRLFLVSLDWLFPPVCGGCNRTGFRWCPECQQQVKPVPEPVCRICGLPLSRPGLCKACIADHPPYEVMRSWVIFEGPIRHALHSLKYRRNVTLGEALAHHLAGYVRTLGWQPDLVAPVPLGRQRMKERGYNQAGLLAKPLSILQNWNYSPGAVFRVRDTRSQVGLSAPERRLNISNAFRADPVRVSGKVILLLDDVTTTGATLTACSEALIKAGAKSVYALTLARALPYHGLQIV